MFEKEYCCIFSYIAFLRFFARPHEALAPQMPPPRPPKRPTTAQRTIKSPITRTCVISFFDMPSSIIDAIRSGTTISIRTSIIIESGVIIEGSLYSFICAASVFIIRISLPFYDLFHQEQQGRLKKPALYEQKYITHFPVCQHRSFLRYQNSAFRRLYIWACL